MSLSIDGNQALWNLTSALPGTQGTAGVSGTSSSQSTSGIFGPGGSFSQLVMALEQSSTTTSATATGAAPSSSATTSTSATAGASTQPQLSAAVQNFLSTLKQALGSQAAGISGAPGITPAQGTGSSGATSAAHHGGHHHGGGGSWLSDLLQGTSSGSAAAGSLASAGSASSSGSTAQSVSGSGGISWQNLPKNPSAVLASSASRRLLGVG